MGILDDAIKEHLELKRRHGAGDSELKQLEDEAFGAAARPGDGEPSPDPLAEAPTEFMAQPNQEAQPDQEEGERRAPRAEIADLQEAPAMEHEAVPEPAGPTTEEREAIAEQPTEMFDVEEELATEAEAPSEEQLIEEEMDEPRLAPVDPLAGLDEGGPDEVEDHAEEAEEADDFFDEKRLSDELDQALEGPAETDEEEPPAHHDEDVLEETPDFLEETPEDDQLWFEQKPPKDFDFDD